MNYGLLREADWSLAVPLLSSIGQQLPNIGFISAAIDGHHVAAVHVVHPVLHGEPVVIEPRYNGKVDFYKLQMPLKRAVPKETFYYVFAPNRKIARLAEGSGMQQLPWAVFRGRT